MNIFMGLALHIGERLHFMQGGISFNPAQTSDEFICESEFRIVKSEW